MESDKLSTDLQNIKEQVDNLYKSNPLLDLPFPTAAWHLLAAAGDDLGRMFQRGPDALPSIDVSAKEFHADLEFQCTGCIRIVNRNCNCLPGVITTITRKLGVIYSSGAKNMRVLYSPIHRGYRGVFELELQGETIQPRGEVFKEPQYLAYNDLLDIHATEEAYSFLDRNMDKDLQDAIKHSLKIKGDRFSYNLNRRLVRDMKRFLKPNIRKYVFVA